MQRSLDLRDDQQEKVYAVLYNHALQLGKVAAEDSAPANPVEVEQAAIYRKLHALESVLTPTQLAGYREQQELQLRYFKRIASEAEPSDADP
jgi:hypothetical protein